MFQKIFGTLLIGGALIGIYFIYQDYWAGEHRARNVWTGRLEPLLRPHTIKHLRAGGAAEVNDASFYSILYLAAQADEHEYDVFDTVKSAAIAAGASPSEAQRIAGAVQDNIQFLRSMNALKDPANLVRLEQGQAPLAGLKGWEDEPLVVSHRLSPVLAPEAANAIPNLHLVPESVRNMASERVNDQVAELARKWLSDEIIYPDTYHAISEQAKQNARRK